MDVDRNSLHDTQVTENSPAPSTAATRATTPSLEIGPGDVPHTPPPPYSTASIARDTARHANIAVQEVSDANIQELFTSLQSQRGVATGCFWRLFRQCKFCPFIVKKDSNHRCIPVIDLTTDDDATIIDLTTDDNATIIDLTTDDNATIIDLTNDDDEMD